MKVQYKLEKNEAAGLLELIGFETVLAGNFRTKLTVTDSSKYLELVGATEKDIEEVQGYFDGLVIDITQADDELTLELDLPTPCIIGVFSQLRKRSLERTKAKQERRKKEQEEYEAKEKERKERYAREKEEREVEELLRKAKKDKAA